MRHLVTVLAGVSLLIAGATSPAGALSLAAAAGPSDGSDPPRASAGPQGRSVVVASTADSGPGSLRHALERSRPYDTITFDPDVFPPDAPVRIVVESELPHLQAGNLTVDASDSWVVLDGSEVSGDWTIGLMIVSDGNTIHGLQVSDFPGPGIAVSAATDNLIGGDPDQGEGPFGQGNLTVRNYAGIGLWSDGMTGAWGNVVTGNLVGTDARGAKGLGNGLGVMIVEGAHDNTVGPGNFIARNHGSGVGVDDVATLGNAITRNRIHRNGGQGIRLGRGAHAGLTAPAILSHDLEAGTLTGATCPGCRVEVYSGRGHQGAIYEGSTTADGQGRFALEGQGSFRGPHLTATATSPDGGTSQFSMQTSGSAGRLAMQRGNDLAITQLRPRSSSELDDNRMGAQFDSFGVPVETYDLEVYPRGVKHARVAITGMEPELVDWERSEFSVDPGSDAVIDRLVDNGVEITYVLMFWDKETWPGAEGAPCTRFRTKGEIERYLEFARFIVGHFKDRIDHYEIWNEPDIEGYCPKYIRVKDYARLVKRAVPVIRAEHPEAKIVVGGVSNLRFPGARTWLFGLLETDILPLVDVIAWHPMYGTSPAYKLYEAYYERYPSMVKTIKKRAEANGFEGEYQADEIGWSTPANAIPDQPWVYDPIVAQKYYGRGILLHLGMDVGVGVPDDYPVIRNLATLMAGAEPADLPVRIRSKAKDVVHYTFATPDGGYLIALWTDGAATPADPGVRATVKVSGMGASTVTGIDVLHGYEQPLVAQAVGEDLVLRNLVVRDYPLLLHLEHAGPVATTAAPPPAFSASRYR